MKALVAAFGDAGHAFPAIGLARALAERGHDVTIESWQNWRGVVDGLGLDFLPAEEYSVYPPPPPGSEITPGAAARMLVPMLEERGFDVVCHDILTMAPALAAEKAGIPRATLVPHVYPWSVTGMPFYSFGAQPPRTGFGKRLWTRAQPVLEGGYRRGREELNAEREIVGLAPSDRLHGGMSRDLVLVATLPALEYPRRWPRETRVTGPIEFELDHPDVPLPPGDDPLVLVAPSTAQDPEGRMVRVALDALADEPVRVLATTNRRGHPLPEAPANAVVVDWLRYSQGLAVADLAICHGGHGTVARALSAGVPLVCCPAGGDMAENGARVTWAGAGLTIPWRFVRRPTLRSTVRRVLADERFARRAEAIARSAAGLNGASTGARLLEEMLN
ncbi:glycosyl transferase [Thermoleophilia bacterium SCSIO 60948]|nr:glycosyl transferase [Thermoleophilia bacterium SCSIO 60948]